MSRIQLSPAALEFVAERHLATFTTLRPDGTAHVTPVGFTWDAEAGVARIITSARSHKARNAAAGGLPMGVLCQVDGRRWLSIEGSCRVSARPADVLDAEMRYAIRYRPPRPNPSRVVVLVEAQRIYGSSALTA